MTTPRKWRITLYQDSKKEWRWTLKAGNGERIADCAEGYKTLVKCQNMVQKIAKLFATATVTIKEA